MYICTGDNEKKKVLFKLSRGFVPRERVIANYIEIYLLLAYVYLYF